MNEVYQKLFDIALNGLRSQNGPSLIQRRDLYNICVYRGRGGKKCAVGHLIADDKYKTSFEQLGTDNNAVFRAVIDSQNIELYDEENLKQFLISMQYHMHDRYDEEDDWPEYFEENVKNFADDNGLVYREKTNELV